MNTAKRIAYVALLLPLLSLAAGRSLRAAEKSDWGNLKQVAPSQTIKVIATDGKSSQGNFQFVSDDALVLRLADGDRSFPRDTVQRVSINRNGHRGKHALLGAGIGALLPAGGWREIYRSR
jgi:hypothetical protein